MPEVQGCFCKTGNLWINRKFVDLEKNMNGPNLAGPTVYRRGTGSGCSRWACRGAWSWASRAKGAGLARLKGAGPALHWRGAAGPGHGQRTAMRFGALVLLYICFDVETPAMQEAAAAGLAAA